MEDPRLPPPEDEPPLVLPPPGEDISIRDDGWGSKWEKGKAHSYLHHHLLLFRLHLYASLAHAPGRGYRFLSEEC